MSRPLVVTDCDEVLLHMVRHFADWLDSEHAVDFSLDGNPFTQSMRRRETGEVLSQDEGWEMLGAFFDTQMDRQTEIPGAVAAIAQLQQRADVVVLTNLADHRAEARTRQLGRLGIDAKVYTNQGPKGAALSAILAEYAPRSALFIDDIAGHHKSALEHVPEVHRLHFCGEPAIAAHIPCGFTAGHAHARIDSWAEALPWIDERLFGDER